MKRTTIFIDEAVEKELQSLASRRGTSTASIVREALAVYVAGASHARELSFVGAGASGRSDVAETHEEQLWESPHEDVGARLPVKGARKSPPRRTPRR